MDAPEDTVQLVMAESERLIRYLTTMPPEAWRAPSACARWEVRDVVAHLAGQGEFYADAMTRSLQGDPSPPGGRPAPGSVNAASDAERGAQRAIARREQLGDQVLNAFRTTNDRLNRLLISLGPQDWEKPLYYVSLGIAPMRFRPAIRLLELVTHSWDIRSRLVADAHLTEESLPVIVDIIVGPLLAPPSWLFVPGPRLPVPLRYRWVLTGVGACEQDIVIEGDRVQGEPAGTAAADVTLRSDAETFVLLMLGRLPLSEALAQCRLVATGKAAQVDAFTQWFRGA
jgi:uncharacterized protein (TIGR03083 family)